MANRITTTFSFKEEGRGLQKIKADMAEVDGSINKAKTGVKGLWAEFKNNRAAQAAAAAVVTKIAVDAVDAASRLQESVNAVTVSYGENAEAVLAIGENAAESFGMSKSEFNGFAVQFSAFAKQVADRDGRAVADVLGEMTTRVADFASVMNLDLNTAAQVFMSTMSGETEPIRRYGKDVSAAAVEQYALTAGLIETKSELTEAIKVQARYGLLMEQTADVAGDFRNTSDSLANSQRILRANLEDTQASLGNQLLPAAEAVTSALVDMTGAIDHVDRATLSLTGGQRGLGDVIGDTITGILMGNQALQGATDMLWGTGDAAKGAAFSIDEARKAYYAQSAAAMRVDYENRKAEETFERSSQALRDNAREATYNADAHDEMGRIQRITTGIVDAAREAQRRYLQSIKHVRDEIGFLKREIDDEQAWLNLQNSIENTIATMADGEVSARDQRLAVLDLKESVLDYAESINLPDRVTTDIVALVDEGKLAEAEALLARFGNGITVPLRPQVINTGGGASIRVDENGNVRSTRHTGGPVQPGQTYQVLPGEVFTPNVPGRVHSRADTERMMTPARSVEERHLHLNITGQLDQRAVASLVDQIRAWERGSL